MIDVIICEIEMELGFDTKVPKMPEKGDKISAWFDGKCYTCEIHSFLYEFKENGCFDRVQINVIAL
jgi:hypothetical protein